MTFKPLLAAKLDPKHPLRFPLLASVKLDGIRAIVRDGKLVSRSLKLIPNEYCQRLFGRPELEGLDGELLVGPPNAANAMQASTAGVMRVDGEPDAVFYVFDDTREDEFGYQVRLAVAKDRVEGQPRVRIVHHENLTCQEELDRFEAAALEAGFEGAMVRDPQGRYKNGRATAKGGELTKIKRHEQDEARIVDFEERMHNGNEATVSELGRTKRSSHQANLTGRGDLGALVCETPDGVRFNVGTGFSDEQRADFWARRPELLGQLVSYKHFAVTGVKTAPRFPVFVGLRHPDDL